MTARDMNRALWTHFTPRWAVLTEVTARPGPDGGQRRIDVLLLRAAGGGIERLAIEVKVTRQDFLNDVRNPDKQEPWRRLAHRHAYAVPEGLVAPVEVPAGSGLLVVTDRRPGLSNVAWAVRAKRPAGHDPGALPLSIVMDGFYRAGRAEAKVKGHGTAGDGADLDEEDLRAELVRLRAENGRLKDQVVREKEQTARWQQAFAAQGFPACATCGRPLRLPRRKTYRSETWEHVETIDQAGCDLLRRAAAIAANNERAGNRRMDEEYLYVHGPVPADLTPVG